MINILQKFILLVCLSLLLTSCSSIKVKVIDAETSQPIENAIVYATEIAKPLWVYPWLDFTDENGFFYISRVNNIDYVAKEGYWISREVDNDKTKGTYTIKMYKICDEYPDPASNGILRLNDIGHRKYVGIITGYVFGLTNRKPFLMNQKDDDPDWERFRQIWISARNRYKYLETQGKKNSVKK
jgi:hypothetical protein